MRKLIVGSLLTASLAALPAAAGTSVDFHVNVAPPAPLYEVVPAPRAGYVWVPGYWDWRGHHHHWVSGYWVRHRPGPYYEPVRRVYRDGHYHRRAGWRDYDRDGVPNRYDRAPHDPYWH